MLDTLYTAIDNYCERTGPEFWSEPANALTNLAFVAAGLWGVAAVRRNRAGGFAELLAWWVVAIGVGSFLFHTFANQLTMWADILPIAGFTLAYTLFCMRRFLRFSWAKSLTIFVVFYAVAAFLTVNVPEWLRAASNGTTGYLPPFLALAFFGVWIIGAGNPAGWYNLAAVGVFVVSVTFRALDPVVCEAMPLGTHFLWHSFNGLMLGIVLAAVALHGAPARQRA